MAHISVVIPVYRAEACLEELYRRLKASLETITNDFEIVLVEDCGGDRSWPMIAELAKRDARVKGMQFSRNFGQHYGITAGLDYCDGDWVVVGVYGQVRDLTWRAADTLIWLDLPLPLVMWRLFWRTLRRTVSRENLWGTGNRETFLNAFFSRQSILLYALKTHRRNRERFAIECAFLGKEKTIVRLKSSRDVEAFLASHSAPAG